MKTQSLLVLAAVAGLVTGCATHKQKCCGKSCDGKKCEMNGCGSKSGCSSKTQCRSHGNCSAASSKKSE